MPDSSGVMEDENLNVGGLPWEEIVRQAVHDMRSPVSSMRTAVEILRLTITTSEKNDRLLGMVDKQLDLLTTQLAMLMDDPEAFKKS